jgi:hypothetical protein
VSLNLSASVVVKRVKSERREQFGSVVVIHRSAPSIP